MDQLVDKNIIKGIFLIILAEYGSFVAETVGCGTQRFLSENILAKQFGSNNILNNAKATILALTNLNEKVELGKYQSSHKQMFYDKIMRKYKNVRIFN